MPGIKTTSIAVPSPRDYARQALRTVGIVDRSHGCWSHEIQGAMLASIPEWIIYPLLMKFLIKRRTMLLKEK